MPSVPAMPCAICHPIGVVACHGTSLVASDKPRCLSQAATESVCRTTAPQLLMGLILSLWSTRQ